LADRRVVVHIFRHHLEDLREIGQRDKCRIESLRLRRIGERGASQVGISLQPIVHIQNFLGIRGGRGDLRQQRIRIKSDRGQ
jgi:hypothetical protein